MVIYSTTNLINGKKYIGKDSNNNPGYLGSGTLLLEDIKEYGRENFKKEIIEQCSTDEELAVRESYWINYYNAVESDKFYNLVDYSAGWNINKLGKKKYDYICNKISKGNKGRKCPILSLDEDRKDKLRAANIGKPKPEGFGKMISDIKLSQNIKYTKEHCAKISKGKLGKPHPKSGKSIIQLDKFGIILNEFKSIEEATRISSKFKQSNISCCLTGFSKTAYGYVWKYK